MITPVVTPVAWGVLGASLVGSVHCAAMCGGFACVATAPARGDTTRASTHIAYQAGRLAMYLTLGAIAGIVGAHVAHLGVLAGIQRAAAIVAGALMIAWALNAFAARRGHALAVGRAPLFWQHALGSTLRRAGDQPPAVRAAVTGVLQSLLPCGWLYVFVASAGGTGSVQSAITTMALFWLGTVPALVTVSVGARRLLAPLGRWMPSAQAFVVLAMGVWSMIGRVGFAHAH